MAVKWQTMESDVSYRCIGEDFDEGVVACGFMRKQTKGRSQADFRIGYYSGFFLLSGSGNYVTKEGETFPISAGDFVQRIPGEVHSTYVDGDGKWLEFFVSFGKSRYEMLQGLGLLPKERVISKPIMEETESCRKHLQRLKAATDNELGILLAEQERLLLKLLSGRPEITVEEKYIDKIHQAADLLSVNPEINLNMEKVAESLSMGYETFRKQFRREMGVSPADYRLQQKMRQACHMLDAGISIKETAALMGYADVYTFSRQFAKTTGQTPGGYRRHQSIHS